MRKIAIINLILYGFLILFFIFCAVNISFAHAVLFSSVILLGVKLILVAPRLSENKQMGISLAMLVIFALWLRGKTKNK